MSIFERGCASVAEVSRSDDEGMSANPVIRARVDLYAERLAKNCDIWTGEPLPEALAKYLDRERSIVPFSRRKVVAA